MRTSTEILNGHPMSSGNAETFFKQVTEQFPFNVHQASKVCPQCRLICVWTGTRRAQARESGNRVSRRGREGPRARRHLRTMREGDVDESGNENVPKHGEVKDYDDYMDMNPFYLMPSFSCL